VLAGWLHRTAQNIAAQTVRTDVRRRAREQEAAAMNELLAATPEADWEQIAPHLDAALGELSEPERDAVMLRYFERQTARDMAQTLGISDEAAQKRVSRAVDRLREFLTKRGVTVGASGLAVVISANAVQAAPVGLALTITTAATLAGTTLATTATVTATKAIAMTALQKTIVTATIAVLAGVGIYEAVQSAHLREQALEHRRQQLLSAKEIQQLRSEYDKGTNFIAALKAEIAKNEDNKLELLRLRGELARFRAIAGAGNTNSTGAAQNPQELSEQQKQIRERLKMANEYMAGEGRLLVLKKRLQLTSEQEASIREVLKRKAQDPIPFSKKLDPDIAALLTPEQKIAGEQWAEEEGLRERNGAAAIGAQSLVGYLRFYLGLDESQQRSALPILEAYQVQLYQLEELKGNTGSNDSMWPMEEEIRRRKLAALKNILTPEEYEILRGHDEAEIDAGRIQYLDR
jgi:hypothetical protein